MSFDSTQKEVAGLPWEALSKETAPQRQKARNSAFEGPRLVLEPFPRVSTPENIGAGFEMASPEKSQATSSALMPASATSAFTPLHEGVMQQVAILRQTKAEALEVVLRPDSNTEIHVHLEVRNGRVEASASCGRDNLDMFGQHWETCAGRYKTRVC